MSEFKYAIMQHKNNKPCGCYDRVITRTNSTATQKRLCLLHRLVANVASVLTTGHKGYRTDNEDQSPSDDDDTTLVLRI